MIKATMAHLDEIFAAHAAPVLWASGGKDSLTLMHLCRPWSQRLVIVHNAVDMGFPGVWDNLQACAETWGFPYLLKTQPPLSYDAYVDTYGWPMEVVPTALDGVTITPFRQEPKVSSWWFCTMTRQIIPLIEQTHRLGATAILTGSRGTDAPLFETGGPTVDAQTQYGWMRYNPLHAWSTEDVYAYVEANSIPLPPHYAWKRHVSFEAPDCQACTWAPQYWAIAKEQYPEMYQRYAPVVAEVYAAVDEQLAQAQHAMRTMHDEAPHGT